MEKPSKKQQQQKIVPNICTSRTYIFPKYVFQTECTESPPIFIKIQISPPYLIHKDGRGYYIGKIYILNSKTVKYIGMWGPSKSPACIKSHKPF